MYTVRLAQIRTIDPADEHQHQALIRPVTIEDYLFQTQSLPLTVESDYANPVLHQWITNDLESQGLDDIDLKFHILDYKFTPENSPLQALCFPIEVISSFAHKGKRYGGPLFGGLVGMFLTIQSNRSPRLCPFKLNDSYSAHYNAVIQQRIAEQIVYEASTISDFELLITALPNRNGAKRNISNYLEAPTPHFMAGGNIFDLWSDFLRQDFRIPAERKSFSEKIRKTLVPGVLSEELNMMIHPENRLRSSAMMIHQFNSTIKDEFINEFIYYFHPKKAEDDLIVQMRELCHDDLFIKKLAYIRHAMPRAKEHNPDHVETKLASNSEINMALLQEIIKYGAAPPSNADLNDLGYS